MGLTIHKGYPCDVRNYLKGRSQKVKYLVIHYVGALGGAKANVKYYGSSSAQASAHYYVGHASEGAEIYQSVAESDTAWHCGTKNGYKHPECRNANSIGIEMCCHQDENGQWYFDRETVDRTVELARDIMERYDLDGNHVLRHFDVTGKKCPAPYVDDGAAWEAFKKRLEPQEEDFTVNEEQVKAMVNEAVRAALAAERAAEAGLSVSDWAEEAWERAVGRKVFDGSQPRGPLTREQGAVILDRLSLL